MTDDQRLDPEVLAHYAVPDPAVDLTDRFVARLGERRPRRIAIVIAAAGALAAAVALFVLWPAAPGVSTGSLAATQRTTAALGTRGVAVAEVGAKLGWRIERDARITQDAGDVFYRVERGGAFVVATPAGEVTVRGTCFRVVVGAEVAVTVYEGRVELANAHGTIALGPGEHATATAATAPTGTQITAVEQRLAEQHARITALEAKLAAQSTAPVAIGDVKPTLRPFDMTREELQRLAAECRFPFDVPPTAGSSLMDKIVDDGMRTADLGDGERAAVKKLIAAFQPAYQNELVAFYKELTGGDGSELDPATLVIEIEQKSLHADLAVAYQRLAAERAGARDRSGPRPGRGPESPDSEAPGTSPIERYLRFALRASDDFERKLAAEIGPARARAFRRTWGLVDFGPECPAKDTP